MSSSPPSSPSPSSSSSPSSSPCRRSSVSRRARELPPRKTKPNKSMAEISDESNGSFESPNLKHQQPIGASKIKLRPRSSRVVMNDDYFFDEEEERERERPPRVKFADKKQKKVFEDDLDEVDEDFENFEEAIEKPAVVVKKQEPQKPYGDEIYYKMQEEYAANWAKVLKQRRKKPNPLPTPIIRSGNRRPRHQNTKNIQNIGQSAGRRGEESYDDQDHDDDHNEITEKPKKMGRPKAAPRRRRKFVVEDDDEIINDSLILENHGFPPVVELQDHPVEKEKKGGEEEEQLFSQPADTPRGRIILRILRRDGRSIGSRVETFDQGESSSVNAGKTNLEQYLTIGNE